MKARLTSPPLLDRVRPSGIDGPLVSAVLATYGIAR